jgi:PAS domain S-box-containing protein
MNESLPKVAHPRRPKRWTIVSFVCFAWGIVVMVAISRMRLADGLLVATLSAVAACATFALSAWNENARWRQPIDQLISSLAAVKSGQASGTVEELPPEFDDLRFAILDIVSHIRRKARADQKAAVTVSLALPRSRDHSAHAMLTKSGLLDASPMPRGSSINPYLSGEYSTTDMINRLDPQTFRWIESSHAEQVFFGWDLADLQTKSFLDILHPADRPRARELFERAVDIGEAFGLVVRAKTSQGKVRAIEVNVGARYGPDQQISHLRCHLTDVTTKVQAERERHLRNLELTKVNAQLRLINRELEELKDRYSDLYENAPAMYFSLDQSGTVFECNQTMLSTVHKDRDQVVGLSCSHLFEPDAFACFGTLFEQLFAEGSIFLETRWVKSSGEVIDVGLVGSLVQKELEPHARFMGQDVTARKRLEAQIQEKNNRLAQTNAELSQKNRELDEFVHVVSHDLQEPLRTLNAFSDFLARDYADRIDGEGQEYIHYIMSASRRMRAMINGLLNLSRLGKVIGDFAEVDLNDVVAVAITDLRELIRAKGAKVSIAGRLPVVYGDHGPIGQLFTNLISNGLKYNRRTVPCVEIGSVTPAELTKSERPPDELDTAPTIIYVKDNGIGIDPQFHQAIFQLFRRLHTHEEFEGTGVGLSLCIKIVQAHSGKIWVESRLGQGATFFVSFHGPPAMSPATAIALESAPGSDPATSQVSLDEC